MRSLLLPSLTVSLPGTPLFVLVKQKKKKKTKQIVFILFLSPRTSPPKRIYLFLYDVVFSVQKCVCVGDRGRMRGIQ